MKKFVDVMSRYLKNIESGIINLNLSQFVTLQFLNYLLYNSYVLHLLMSVEEILDAHRQGGNSDGQVLGLFHCEWKSLSQIGFVADINSSIRYNDSSFLFPDTFGTSIPVVANADAE